MIPTLGVIKVEHPVMQEWRRNARFRYAVYVMLAIIWMLLIIAMRDRAEIEKAAWKEVAVKIVQAKATASSADWMSRLTQAKSAVQDLESLLWKEGSAGLSQAAFQERVVQLLATSGVVTKSVRNVVSVEGDTGIGGLGVFRMGIRAQVEFRPSTMYRFLAELRNLRAATKPLILTDSLTIRSSSAGQNPVAEIDLVAYGVRPSDDVNIRPETADGAGGSRR